jgi:hypothetical protein
MLHQSPIAWSVSNLDWESMESKTVLGICAILAAICILISPSVKCEGNWSYDMNS